MSASASGSRLTEKEEGLRSAGRGGGVRGGNGVDFRGEFGEFDEQERGLALATDLGGLTLRQDIEGGGFVAPGGGGFVAPEGMVKFVLGIGGFLGGRRRMGVAAAVELDAAGSKVGLETGLGLVANWNWAWRKDVMGGGLQLKLIGRFDFINCKIKKVSNSGGKKRAAKRSVRSVVVGSVGLLIQASRRDDTPARLGE